MWECLQAAWTDLLGCTAVYNRDAESLFFVRLSTPVENLGLQTPTLTLKTWIPWLGTVCRYVCERSLATDSLGDIWKIILFGIWEITAQSDAWFSALYKYSYLLTYLLTPGPKSDSDSDSDSIGLIVWHNDRVLKNDLGKFLILLLKSVKVRVRVRVRATEVWKWTTTPLSFATPSIRLLSSAPVFLLRLWQSYC